MDSLNKKFLIGLIAVAGIGALLLYVTVDSLLTGATTGLSLGLSVRLFMAHKKNGFIGAKKLDWILLMVLSGIACALMVLGDPLTQAILLMIVAVRAIILYFTIYDQEATAITQIKG